MQNFGFIKNVLLSTHTIPFDGKQHNNLDFKYWALRESRIPLNLMRRVVAVSINFHEQAQ